MKLICFVLSLFFYDVALGAENPPLSLDLLIERIEKNQSAESAANKKREIEFSRKKNLQTRKLAQAKIELRKLEARSKKLENVFNENNFQLTKLNNRYVEKLGDFAEMFGAVRLAASKIQNYLRNSLISGERKNRAEKLDPLIKTKNIPTAAQIQILWEIMLEELIEQGKIVSFEGTLIDEDGKSKLANITRIGSFVAIHQGEYLNYLSQSRQFKKLLRQPASKFLDAAENVETSTGNEIINAAIDPSSGAILALLISTPSLLERIQQGGLVGYLIILTALVGLALAIWRFLVLYNLRKAVDAQIADIKNIKTDNPLGRVLAKALSTSSNDSETLEFCLNDAILPELSELERYLPLIKILAAITPLLGLLGTVTGMILTFQAITLFGTGDAKLMAGGISQALVTTVLGLIAAIPLILLHTLAAQHAREIQQVLEEQAAGIMIQKLREH